MTQLGRQLPREDFRNRAPNLCAGPALTTSISGNPEAHGSQDGIQPSAAEVFDRSLLATSGTFPPLFTMLLQLLLYYGVLQPIRNLLRFPLIDSEAFRSCTRGEPFDGAQRPPSDETIFLIASIFLARRAGSSVPSSMLMPEMPVSTIGLRYSTTTAGLSE